MVKRVPRSPVDDDAVRPFAYFRAGARGDAASSRPILVLEDVYKYFDRDRPVLRGVNLEIERGEFVFVTGPSGAGKSTMLQLIYRKQTVDEGRILFCGRDIARLTPDSIPFLRRNLGIVFQDFKVVPHWTVAENVAVPLDILAMPAKVVRARVTEALERVGLAGRGNDRTGTLSGGEQQRVAVARAIVTEPALVLADEPTGNLDPQLALDILTLFEEINQTGITVVFATHDHSLLEARPHRLVVIDEGRVFEARRGLAEWHDSGLQRRPDPAAAPARGADRRPDRAPPARPEPRALRDDPTHADLPLRLVSGRRA
jgi:cell division transport system ATP-binding protein